MAISPTELRVRQRLVRAFIQADYADIYLRRVTKKKTETGAFRKQESLVTVLPQRTRLIPSKRRFNTTFVNLEAGNVEKWPYALIGSASMDVQEDDMFVYQGKTYIVRAIEPDREERTLMHLDYAGSHKELL